MLAPETVAAIRFGLNAKLLTEACDLDRDALDAWLDAEPDDKYATRLKIHAHLLSTQNTISEGAAR